MTQPFFVAGGALRADAPSYIERNADNQLYQLALAGQFAYVLTARQMGKSSLMNRTARRLTQADVKSVRIDLTGIGVVTIDEWYYGLITEIYRQLRLDIDLQKWWTEHENLSHIQRAITFLREVVLEQHPGQIAIFIDEIDTTLKLAFADDFFAGIRSIYNARDAEPAWDRLSFILLGVATPSDLIQDNSRTPFNIGQGVELLDFSQEEAQRLQDGLTTLPPDQQKAVFARIFYWTDGHPYMTQHLCEQVAKNLDITTSAELVEAEPVEAEPIKADVEGQVDALVQQHFLTKEAQNEQNLSYVRDRVITHPQRRQLLRTYRSVLQGRTVKEDRQSIVQNELKLAALVKEKDGNLEVRNRIYARNFDLAWVKELMEINWTAVAAWALGVVAFLAVGLIVYDLIVDYWAEKAASELAYDRDLSTPERRKHLATLFRSRQIIGQTDYPSKAIDAFYAHGWTSAEQLAVFKINSLSDSHDVRSIIEGLYTTFAQTDNVPENLALLQQINQTLGYIESEPQPFLERLLQRNDTTELRRSEFQSWIEGREYTYRGDTALALNAYATAIAINGENHAMRFERAQLWIIDGNYTNALEDLDVLAGIARRVPTPTPATQPTLNIPTRLLSTPTLVPASLPANSTPISPDSAQLNNRQNTTLSVISTPTPPFYRSDFIDSSDYIDAIQSFVYRDSDLSDTLFGVSDIYKNLDELRLVPYVTSTPLIVMTDIPDTISSDFDSERTGAIETLETELTSQGTTPQIPLSCQQLVINGTFDIPNLAWRLSESEHPPAYQSDITHLNSKYALVLGHADPRLPDVPSTSFIEQDISLPSKVGYIMLHFYYYPILYDDDPAQGDLQYMQINHAITEQFIERPLITLRNDRRWLDIKHDLTYMAGQEIRLRFEVINDGKAGRTAMYVDNVSVHACDIEE